MAIRPFLDECWIHGVFNEEGKLMDVQQYPDKQKAIESADKLKDEYYTFVGKLKVVSGREHEAKPKEEKTNEIK